MELFSKKSSLLEVQKDSEYAALFLFPENYLLLQNCSGSVGTTCALKDSKSNLPDLDMDFNSQYFLSNALISATDTKKQVKI